MSSLIRWDPVTLTLLHGIQTIGTARGAVSLCQLTVEGLSVSGFECGEMGLIEMVFRRFRGYGRMISLDLRLTIMDDGEICSVSVVFENAAACSAAWKESDARPQVPRSAADFVTLGLPRFVLSRTVHDDWTTGTASEYREAVRVGTPTAAKLSARMLELEARFGPSAGQDAGTLLDGINLFPGVSVHDLHSIRADLPVDVESPESESESEFCGSDFDFESDGDPNSDTREPMPDDDFSSIPLFILNPYANDADDQPRIALPFQRMNQEPFTVRWNPEEGLPQLLEALNPDVPEESLASVLPVMGKEEWELEKIRRLTEFDREWRHYRGVAEGLLKWDWVR